MGGASFGGAYYTVDELDFRIDLSLDDGFTGWIRIRTFDDYGMLDSEDTEYLSWDVTQFEGLVIYGIGSFSFDGQVGTLYLNSDFGLGDGAVLYMMPWDDIDSWDSGDSEDYPEDDTPPEPEPEPEPEPQPQPSPNPGTPPAPPVIPQPGGKPSTRPAQPNPGTTQPQNTVKPQPEPQAPPMPPDASPIPATEEAQRQAIETLYQDCPELMFSQGFAFMDGAASYFSRLPRIYDPVEDRFFLSSQEIYALIPRPEAVDFKTFSDGSLIARFTNRSRYPILGAEMSFSSASNPAITLTATNDALTMPGQQSPNLYGRLEGGTQIPTDLQLQSITIHVLDKLAGVATLHSDFTTGQISLKGYDQEAVEDAHFMDELEVSTLNNFLTGIMAGSDRVTITNSYRRALIGVELQLDYPDGTRHTIRTPEDATWRLAPGETSELSDASFWVGGFTFNAVPPFIVSELRLQFEDSDDNWFEPTVYDYLAPLQLLTTPE